MTIRTRGEWNNRFEHWERPASDSEELKIDRAAAMVRQALNDSAWLLAEGVTVHPQGSYNNNTNVRVDADMDLRALHPSLKISYHSNVNREAADGILGYSGTGRTLGDISDAMRGAIGTALGNKFGRANVNCDGNKAIRVRGLPGSRAEVDIVPAFRLHHVIWIDASSRYHVIQGVAILARSGQFTFNFPEQHFDNGVAKRERTRHRFKRNVRILKRLQNELIEIGALQTGAPSFLVECLVYCVEDVHFLVDADDRYDRTRRIVRRLEALLGDQQWVNAATEINEVKGLFGSWQSWTAADAIAFVTAARIRLEG